MLEDALEVFEDELGDIFEEIPTYRELVKDQTQEPRCYHLKRYIS